jgi:hypothetical protein
MEGLRVSHAARARCKHAARGRAAVGVATPTAPTWRPAARRAAPALRPRAARGGDRAAKPASLVQATPPSPWRSVEGAPLTKDEATSLRTILAAPPGAAVLGAGGDAAEICQRAAALLLLGLGKQAQDLAALEGAMLVAEQVRMGVAALRPQHGWLAVGADAWRRLAEPQSTCRVPLVPDPHDTLSMILPCQASLGTLPSGSGSSKAAAQQALLRGDAGADSVAVWQPIFASAGGFPR